MEEHLDIQDKTCALLQQQQPQQLDDDGHLLDSGPPITCDKSVATLATAYASIYASDTNLMAPDISLRGRMSRMFCTHRFQVICTSELLCSSGIDPQLFLFQVTIVSLVILDCIIVIAELLMDLRLLNLDEQQTSRSTKADYVVPDVLHCINIAILSMFCAECLIKVFAFGLSFLRHGWEIFDTTVVAATFALDVASQHSHTATTGFGLLIILRLWRVARILNGTITLIPL